MAKMDFVIDIHQVARKILGVIIRGMRLVVAFLIPSFQPTMVLEELDRAVLTHFLIQEREEMVVTQILV
jgi:hypothetical protein